jgi:hypothetical protein
MEIKSVKFKVESLIETVEKIPYNLQISPPPLVNLVGR